MSWESRQEKEIKRLAASGRPIYATREDHDDEGRVILITATLRKVGQRYQFLLDVYYPTGVTGDTIREEGKVFDDLEAALDHLCSASGIPLYRFGV